MGNICIIIHTLIMGKFKHKILSNKITYIRVNLCLKKTFDANVTIFFVKHFCKSLHAAIKIIKN